MALQGSLGVHPAEQAVETPVVDMEIDAMSTASILPELAPAGDEPVSASIEALTSISVDAPPLDPAGDEFVSAFVDASAPIGVDVSSADSLSHPEPDPIDSEPPTTIEPPNVEPKSLDEIIALFHAQKQPQHLVTEDLADTKAFREFSSISLQHPGMSGPLVHQNEEIPEKVSCACPDCPNSFEPNRQFVSQKYCCHSCYEKVRLALKSLKYWYKMTKCKIVLGIYCLLHPLGLPP